jgi:hypothetical protein
MDKLDFHNSYLMKKEGVLNITIKWISNKEKFLKNLRESILFLVISVIPISIIYHFIFPLKTIPLEYFIVFLSIFTFIFVHLTIKTNVPRSYFIENDKIVYKSFLLTRKLLFSKIKRVKVHPEKKYIDFTFKNGLIMQLVIRKEDVQKLENLLKTKKSIQFDHPDKKND